MTFDVNEVIAITGTGLVTPLGSDLTESWAALSAGRSISDHAKVIDEIDRGCNKPRVTRLALRAAREAICSARWTEEQLRDPSTALVVGTSKGPIEDWMSAPPLHMSDEAYVTAGQPRPIGLHQVAESLADDLSIGCGPRTTLSAACSSGLHALIHAVLMMRSSHVRRALVVAAEAAVHPLFVSSFKRLGVLPPDGFGCRPFDENRAGFLMSEAAAAVCLEIGESSNHVMALIDRFALGADATHITGSDPDGKTLRRLLAQVIGGRQVDLIHAHGTGTRMNDQIELSAIEESLATSCNPWLYSHKGALGHSQGAAGLISVVLNVESHRNQVILPNANTSKPISMSRVRFASQLTNSPVHQSIAIASGFGGPVAVLSCVSS